MTQARITDVATAAGVSTSTVSLVLNNRPTRISETTKERVRAAAEAVGYTPNSVARGLRTQRTRMVGLISDTIATTPFAGRMLAGAEEVARGADHLVILVDTDGIPEVEDKAIRALASQQVDALIYAAMWHREVELPAGVPADTVFLDCRPAGGGFAAVVPDDRAGGRAAVRALVAAGHRRIAYVSPDEDLPPVASELRHQGYLDVLAEAGIDPDPALHVSAEVSAAGGSDAIERLLALGPQRRPTAVFCFNDRVAAGVYRGARRAGLDIPRDLSVVGFDDQAYIASELDPPLTTVALPHYEMGRWAMEVALGIREASPEDDPHLMMCPMVHRDSIGPPPAAALSAADGGPVPPQ